MGGVIKHILSGLVHFAFQVRGRTGALLKSSMSKSGILDLCIQ